MKKYLSIWAIVWVIIYFIVDGIGYPDAAGMVTGTAIISLFIMLKFLGKHWSGEVVETKTEEKYYADEDGGGTTQDVDYAYVKLTDGKIKKIKNFGWKVGDKLEKKRGEFKAQLVS